MRDEGRCVRIYISAVHAKNAAFLGGILRRIERPTCPGSPWHDQTRARCEPESVIARSEVQPILAVLASRATKLAPIVAATLVAGAVLAPQFGAAVSICSVTGQSRDSARVFGRAMGSGRGLLYPLSYRGPAVILAHRARITRDEG